MIGAILSFLISLSPLIVQAGLYLISKFIKDKAEKEQASNVFLSAIQSHLDDALKSVAARYGDQKQDEDLKKMADELDKPSPPT